MLIVLNKDEVRAIKALKRLAKIWPQSLSLLSMCSDLCVMKTDLCHVWPVGTSNNAKEGVNPDAQVCKIEGIPNDGGGW